MGRLSRKIERKQKHAFQCVSVEGIDTAIICR